MTTPGPGRLEAELTLFGRERPVRLSVWDGDKCLARQTGQHRFTIRVPGAKEWSPEFPMLYTVRAELLDEGGAVRDVRETLFGFRTV